MIKEVNILMFFFMFKNITIIYRKIYLAFWILGFYFDTGKITYNVSQLDLKLNIIKMKNQNKEND
jgi:hypothetical protein